MVRLFFLTTLSIDIRRIEVSGQTFSCKCFVFLPNNVFLTKNCRKLSFNYHQVRIFFVSVQFDGKLIAYGQQVCCCPLSVGSFMMRPVFVTIFWRKVPHPPCRAIFLTVKVKSDNEFMVSEFSLGFGKLEFKNPLLWKVGVQTEKLEFTPKTLELKTASC